MMMMARTALGLGLLLTAAAPAPAQAVAAPSGTPARAKLPTLEAQRYTASFSFPDGKTTTIDYGSLPVPAGKAFPQAVPLEQIWAAGAGRVTTLKAAQELRLAEGSIHRGSYGLYVRPSATQWLLMVNQKTGQDAGDLPANYEYARFKLNHRELPAGSKPTARLVYRFKKLGPRKGRLLIAFGRTEAWLDFEEGNNKAHIHGEKEEDDD